MTISTNSDISSTGLRPLTSTAWQDLIGGLAKTDLWGRLGWLDVRRRYRRTLLGPFWTSISLAMYVLAVGMAGAGLWHQEIRQYLPFLISGMIVWMLVSTIINESCSSLVAGHALFRHVSFEYSILAYALVWRNLIIFVHNLVVYVLIVGALRPELLSPMALMAVPGVMLVLVNGVWMALLCGMLCLRFRDVQPLIATVVQISMLVTPLFWPADTLVGMRRLVFVELNPLYHVLNVVRAPFLGQMPTAIDYCVVVFMAVGGWWLAYLVFRHFRKRISYWS